MVPERALDCFVQRKHCRSLIFFAILVLTGYSYAVDHEEKLENIRQSIAEKEHIIQQHKQRQNALQDQLKQQENTIVQANQRLNEIQTSVAELNKDVTNITHSMQKLRAYQLAQQEVLAKQLEAAFRQGRYNGWQLILNAQESQRRERILVWFSYLNQARYASIEKIKQTQAELATQKQIQQQKQEQQKQLLAEQEKQKNNLEHARAERAKTLGTLETALKKDQLVLVQLKENETGLRDKILLAEREARVRAQHEAKHEARMRAKRETSIDDTPQEVSEVNTVKPQETQQTRKASVRHSADEGLMVHPGGLGKPNGRAVWPLQGPVLHHFGETVQGELRWKGMVISAPEGTEVKAIADGNVLLTDWLQGYGLVVVIEHGVSDMSVYGYNQNALVEVGASVKAGQPVALVGDSGGQGYPALYLEIRRQGQAVNPLPWLGK